MRLPPNLRSSLLIFCTLSSLITRSTSRYFVSSLATNSPKINRLPSPLKYCPLINSCHKTLASISASILVDESSSILSKASRLCFLNTITSVIVSALAAPNTLLGKRYAPINSASIDARERNLSSFNPRPETHRGGVMNIAKPFGFSFSSVRKIK